MTQNAKNFNWAIALFLSFILVACTSTSASNFKPALPTLLLPSAPLNETNTLSPISEWSIYRHAALGVEVRYPTGWEPYDYTQAFIRFREHNGADEAFNIVNASFGLMHTPADFLKYVEPTMTIAITRTLVIDGQPAIFIQFKPGEQAAGYQSMVGLIRPDGHTLTVGNHTVDPVLFEQIISTIRFFEVVEP